MRDFVLEWFDEISEDAAFPISVEKSVRIALVNLRERIYLNIPDPTDTMVRKFLPMFTTHLADFTTAERAVRGSRILTESEEVDKIVATRYGASKPAGLHPATALSFSDPTSTSARMVTSINGEGITSCNAGERSQKSCCSRTCTGNHCLCCVVSCHESPCRSRCLESTH